MNRQLLCNILNSELELATGCTEPACIAYAAATARTYLPNTEIRSIEVGLSVNMIKNAMAAGIPGTDRKGIEFAAALGATGGDSQKLLNVVISVSEEAVRQAKALVDSGRVSVYKADSENKLHVDLSLTGADGTTVRVVISREHTNIVLIAINQNTVYKKESDGRTPSLTPELITETLSIDTIYNFVRTLDPAEDDLHMVEQAIAINERISEAGLRGDYGLNVGRQLKEMAESGLISQSVTLDGMIAAASGSDARMAGAPFPVVTNSGSGNQGITATMPVLAMARSLKADSLLSLQAVTLSHLMAIHIHSRFGRLSGLCGAMIAATGASCAITYLLGGDERQIGYAVNNMLGDLTGLICDGAKGDCAFKISTCVSAAFQSAYMARKNISISAIDGIVESDPEETIVNLSRLGNEGSLYMDNVVLDIILKKSQK